MSKAHRTLSSAGLLLNSGDAEGACNRAYYAMFNAAHAALLAVGSDAPANGYRTHHGLIAAFGKYLVLGGYLDPAFGRMFNQVQQTRQLADYVGEPVSHENAGWAVDRARTFVQAIQDKFPPA